MEDTQKQDKLPPIKYTKRVGHLFEHVRDIDNLKEAIKDAARHKRKRKEVQKVLEDIDGHALELQRMLDEETFIPAKYTMRRINDGIQKKTRDIAIPRFWPDQCVHHAFVRIFKQIVLHSAYPFSCGLARVFIKGLGYGYIDRQGNEVVPCKYQEAEDFHDFRAKVKQYDRVLTIDETGQIVEQ